MKRLLRICIPALALLMLVAVLAAWLGLRASLPRQSGSVELAGLANDVTLEFDDRGIARILASELDDAFAAQGFVHAQDRFFQMDLARRSAAGELAALVGAAAIGFDSQRRALQLRSRAAALLGRLPQSHREFLRRYTAGVNAGLADLGAWPPEYLLLRRRPQPWLEEDSVLVAFAMYTMLSNNDSLELHNGALRALLPQPVFEFLTPISAREDRPLAARSDVDTTGGYTPVAMPGAEIIDLRSTSYDGSADIVRQPLAPIGSNNWAIAGLEEGAPALLANDPHLGLRVPNVFHRTELLVAEAELRGVGIAGFPGILIGTNGSVGWGATVSYADQADYVVVDVDPRDASRYLTPTGAEAFGVHAESIEVAGRAEPVAIEIRTTRWGPIVETDFAGRPLALRATWLDPDGFDFGLLELARARTAAAAIEILNRWRGPSLNWVTADAQGGIGWTINGPIPLRRNFEGDVPERWGTGEFGWRGESMLPWTLSNPTAAAGEAPEFVYSANNRQLTLPYARTLSRFSLTPYRAKSIADALGAGTVTDEADSLELQLDTRVRAFGWLAQSVLQIVPPAETDPALALARSQVAAWNERAEIDSAAIPLLDRFYDGLLERLLGTALQAVRDADARFLYRWPLADEVLRRILEERPANLLPAGHDDWDMYLREILRGSLELNGRGELPRWGAANRLQASHPLGGVPGIGALLNWPQPELPGHPLALRVARPGFGAVFRMNVRPGAPHSGILQFAGGQSGHFLSPHYVDQLADWADGVATPFMAGSAQHTYVLRPTPQNSAR